MNPNPIFCSDCPHGKPEIVCGNGITEPPYLRLIRCPFETEYYKYPDDECNHKEEKKKGSKIMKSKWKVTYNPMMESKPYAVVRLRNTSECEHSGNREYGSEYMASREEAQAIADKLNAEENQHYTAKAETAHD